MKITFDTKEETSESLQLVIQFLNGLQKIQKPNNNQFTNPEQSLQTDIEQLQNQSPFHSIPAEEPKQAYETMPLGQMFGTPEIATNQVAEPVQMMQTQVQNTMQAQPMQQEQPVQQQTVVNQPQYQIPNIFNTQTSQNPIQQTQILQSQGVQNQVHETPITGFNNIFADMGVGRPEEKENPEPPKRVTLY